MLSAFASDSCSCVECLNVVVGASDSEESKWHLKTHVVGLEALGADRHHPIVIHVGDNEAVCGADHVVIVDVV